MENNTRISNNKIRQIALLGIICAFLFLIGKNLSAFLPSLLGAITFYVVFRDYYYKLTETKKWRPWLAITFLMVVSILVILTPIYYLIHSLISKISNSAEYVGLLNEYIDTLRGYVEQKTGYDMLASMDTGKIAETISSYSSSLVVTTVDMFNGVIMAYFILYFLLINSRKMEKAFNIMIPLKRSNINKLGDKFRKLIIANVIGIPVVALGQGLTVLIGYLIFGVPNPFLLFVLTTIASVIPIVGGALIYIPVALMLLVNNDMAGMIGVLSFGALSAGIDNVMRFTFLKKIEDIHPLNSVFGIILGLKVFGFIGLVFGPILVSITILLIRVYYDEFSEKNDIEEVDELMKEE